MIKIYTSIKKHLGYHQVAISFACYFTYFVLLIDQNMIRNLLFSHDPEYFWLSLLLFLGVILAVVLWYKRLDFSPIHEGFDQAVPYVFVSGQDVYADEFYVAIHDRLMLPQETIDDQVQKMVAMTFPSQRSSVFLDVGSGTGMLATRLANEGYSVYAVDKSQAMVDFAMGGRDKEAKCKDTAKSSKPTFKVGDILDPMLWEPGTFSHITCTGFTIYSFENKLQVLRNCLQWLQPGGYFIVHLVDKDQFESIIPAGRPRVMDWIQTPKRITETNIDFVDFEYTAIYDFSNDPVTLRETFTDSLSKNVRQQEQIFYMNSVPEIIALAQSAGFVPKGYANFAGDKHQFLYIFSK